MLAVCRHALNRLVVLASLLVLAACQTPSGLNPAQVAMLQQHGFELTDQGWALGLSSKVLFGSDEARLGAASLKAVQDIGAGLASVGILTVRVDGHTDDQGSDAYNDALSQKRASAVAAALAQAGLPSQGIFPRGLGKRYPVASNDTRVGRAQNRRVSIVVASH